MAGSSEKLSVYLHRAKGGGELAARAVEGAIDDADVYVFGELLDAEPVRAVSGVGCLACWLGVTARCLLRSLRRQNMGVCGSSWR